MLLDRGAIVLKDGHWVSTESISGIEIPRTIHSLLLARIDRLAAEPRSSLRVGSVLGREFGARLLRDVQARAGSHPATDEDLAALQGSGLVRTRSDGTTTVLRFRHALVQEAAYGSLLRAERSTLHRAAAEALESGADGRPSPTSRRRSASTSRRPASHPGRSRMRSGRLRPHLPDTRSLSQSPNIDAPSVSRRRWRLRQRPYRSSTFVPPGDRADRSLPGGNPALLGDGRRQPVHGRSSDGTCGTDRQIDQRVDGDLSTDEPGARSTRCLGSSGAGTRAQRPPD